MFHVLQDDGELVAVLANVTTAQVQDAISKVDVAFRKFIDTDLVNLEQHMCEDLGIAYSEDIAFWTDVLVALLVDCGATPLGYVVHECAPEPASAGRTEESSQ
jgi:hypothetical protein